ncbi:unnamed protein product [Lactuca virosa]|uniref:Uncharacterized protein n=1 Tax=Lactuca virosa TaxID=75947 RepID=A0AAU9MVD3_9ASTR|nr:unnamed protein product [Lactuca virosa]
MFHLCSSPSSCRLQNVLPSFVDYLDRSDRGRISDFCFFIDDCYFYPLIGAGSPSNNQGKKLQSSKQAVTSNKGKEKMIELPAKRTDMWELPLRYHNKGITIGSPPRPPPPVHENAMISKSKDQSSTDTRTGIKKRKRRNKQQNIVEFEPSCWNRICPQDVVDAGIHLNPAKKKHSVWFSLTPSCDQNRKNTLQLLVEPYVQIIMEGNCNPDVSILMKYIVLQLKHVCQQEVGIFLNGKLLAPEMKLLDVVKQWMAIVDSESKITKIGSSAENFCVKLTYARRQ